VAADELREEGEVEHRRRPAAGPVGRLTAVAHDVEAELSVGRLDRGVRLRARDLEAAVGHRELEVGDRALNRRVDLLLRRPRHPLVDAHVDVARREVFQRLMHDLQALAHLLHADEIPGVAIPGARTADLELEVLVGEIGLVLAEVAGHPAGPGHGAGGAAGDRLFLREHTHALGAVDEDPVAGQEPLHVVERLGEGLEEGADLLDHQGREILRHTSDAGVGVREPRAAERLEDVVDHLALVEAVQKEGEGAGVEAHGAVAQQVIADPGELGDDRADVLAPRGQLQPQQRLDRVVPGDVVGHRRDVVHPVGHGDVLVERQVLADLLEAGVQIAHLGDGVDHPLALELEHQAERRVRGRVLRSEVQRPQVVLGPGARFGAALRDVDFRGGE